MEYEAAEAMRLAQDPNTDPATLYRLAQEYPEVLPALAENPAAYPDLLAWLGSLANPEVDRALARRRAADSKPPQRTSILPAPGAAPAVRPAPVTPAPVQRTSVLPAPVDRDWVNLAKTDHSPMPPPAHSRRPLAIVLGVVALAAVALGTWFAISLLGGGGEPGPSPTAAPTDSPPAATPSAPATTEQPPASPGPGEDPASFLRRATEQLRLISTTTICNNAPNDASHVVTLAQAARAVDAAATSAADQEVRAALAAIQTRCNTAYAVVVAETAVVNAAEFTSLTSRDWVSPTVPTPADALALKDFVSPSRNIACILTASGATCTITAFQFSPPPGCTAGAPVSLVVDADGARADCTVTVPASETVLEYRTSAAQGRFACASGETAMECWDSWSGARFTLARAATVTTGPIFGFSR